MCTNVKELLIPDEREKQKSSDCQQ